MVDFKEENPSFPTQQNHPLRSNRKHQALSVSKTNGERERERHAYRDIAWGENSNIIKICWRDNEGARGRQWVEKIKSKTQLSGTTDTYTDVIWLI